MREKHNPSIAGIILAGGEGSRMGGQDKGLITLHGEPLIHWCTQRLVSQVDELVISANRHRDIYQHYAKHVIGDQQAEVFQGPIAGILAAFAATNCQAACVVPVDAPLLPRNLVALLEHHSEQRTRLTLLEVDGRLQPLFALYPARLIPSLQHYFAYGGRKLVQWCLAESPVVVQWQESSDAFSNINTPDILEKLERSAVCANLLNQCNK